MFKKSGVIFGGVEVVPSRSPFGAGGVRFRRPAFASGRYSFCQHFAESWIRKTLFWPFTLCRHLGRFAGAD